MRKTKRAKAELRPEDCPHNWPLKQETLSADGKRRYGLCPRCQTHVQVEPRHADDRSSD